MREIKFRAWHKKYKKLYEVLHLHNSGHEGLWATCKGCDVIEQKDIHIHIQPNDIELMQYTGLKDKNGVEIYEGDILTDHIGKGVVRYSDKNAAFRVSYGDGRAKWFYDYTLKGEIESIEVIGNIHENAELLT